MGFPGETEQDFRETLAFIRDLPFTDLHIFTYSPRPGTPAASWPGRPPKEISRRRLHQAQSLIDHKNARFRRSLTGSETRVLVEQWDPRGESSGMADTYVKVSFHSHRELVGRLVRVQLDTLNPKGMNGTILEAFV